MANLNLSQFTEKTFVADADWTFVWDAAGLISKKVSRNNWLSVGSITTSTPVTISQTWTDAAVTFAAMKIVATDTNSAAGSDFLELYSGTSTQPLRLDIQKTGQVNIYGTWTNSTTYERLSLSAPTAANAIIGTNRSGGTARGLDLHTDGAARMTIGTTGNVGIGTTAPSQKLHVDGNGLFGQKTSSGTATPLNVSFGGTYGTSAPGSKANLKWDLYTDAIATNRFGIGMSVNLMEIQAGDGAGFGFYPNAGTTSALHIISSGNVGIGTTAPSSKLHVVGDALVTGNSSLNNGSFNTTTARVASLIPIVIGTSGYLGFTSGFNPDSSSWDTVLLRDEQYHLALRNGANGQKFSVYGTYPGAAWERFTITAPTSGNVLLGTYKGTGGIARGLELQADGVTRLSISGSGPFLATFGSAFNSQWLELSANAGTTLQYNSTHKIYFSSAACEITANNTTITTGLVRFSGTTASFPALKRSSTTLQARLADDSAFAPIQGKLTTDTDYTATVVTPTGFLTLYDAQGTAYRVPCVLAP